MGGGDDRLFQSWNAGLPQKLIAHLYPEEASAVRRTHFKKTGAPEKIFFRGVPIKLNTSFKREVCRKKGRRKRERFPRRAKNTGSFEGRLVFWGNAV